jgi:hypothetical protein
MVIGRKVLFKEDGDSKKGYVVDKVLYDGTDYYLVDINDIFTLVPCDKLIRFINPFEEE